MFQSNPAQFVHEVCAQRDALVLTAQRLPPPKIRIGSVTFKGELFAGGHRPEDPVILSHIAETAQRIPYARIVEVGAGGSLGRRDYGTPTLARSLAAIARQQPGAFSIIATDQDIALSPKFEARQFGLVAQHLNCAVPAEVQLSPLAGKADFVYGRFLGAMTLSRALLEFGASRYLLTPTGNALLCFECITDIHEGRMLLLDRSEKGKILNAQGIEIPGSSLTLSAIC